MRCFVAIDLSADVRAAIARLQAELRAAAPDADVRWVDPAGMHLTLKFLGEVAPTRCQPVLTALAAATGPVAPIALGTGGAGGFPSARRPRVAWAGITAGAAELAALASRVDAALAGLGFPPEARPFRGHVTLGRVRSARGLGALATALEARAGVVLGAWQVRTIVLYRSHLSPRGATYEALAQVPLGSAGATPDP